MNANYTIESDDLSNIIFITGGTKSGKSEFAEYLAKNFKKLSDFNRKNYQCKLCKTIFSSR